jgi:hypothetical protein
MRLLPVLISAVVAGTAGVAGGALAPAAASAAIRFDPVTKTGFVDAEDVRKAFGWDTATLARNAPEIRFTYHVGKDEIYSVLCERDVRAGVSHNPGSISAGLTPVVTVDLSTGDLSGFRLIGAESGASSIGIRPEAGHPCPAEGGGIVRRATYVHTTTTEALSAEFRDVQVYLTQDRTVSTAPPPASAGG